MQSRIKHVLGLDLAPATSTAKRLVSSAEIPQNSSKGFAPACLWITTEGSVYVNTGDESSSSWSNLAMGFEIGMLFDEIHSIFSGTGSTLPTSEAATVGKLFLRTGNTDPGLYVCTATTSSSSTWKAVSHAS